MKLSADGQTLERVNDDDIVNGRFSIPDSVTSIGDGAFRDCTNLTTVIFNENLERIEWGAFYGCTNLTTVTFNENLTHIGDQAFDGCTSLITASFNKNLRNIGNFAFWRCTSLTTVTFNGSLIEIGEDAFFECVGLTKVIFNGNITKDVGLPFLGCTGITTIIFNGNVWEDLREISRSEIYNEECDLDEFFDGKGCIALKNIIIGSEKDHEVAKIIAMVPEELRNKIVPNSVCEQTAKIQKRTLELLCYEPSINPLYSFFNIMPFGKSRYTLGCKSIFR